MKLGTKTVASLFLLSAVSVMPGMGRQRGSSTRESQFDRLLQHHDRKAELRADLLGMTPLEFREMHQKQSFDEIIRTRGFKDMRQFRLALLGKLRSELLNRGWSRQKIERHMTARSQRFN